MPRAYNTAEDKLASKRLLNSLLSDDSQEQKEAAGDAKEYLRMYAKEDGVWRNIIEPYYVQPEELQKTTETSKPALIKEMQPNSNAAFSVPFGVADRNEWLGVPRYAIVFQRLFTPRYYADVADLLTISMPIQQVFSDLMLKELLAEEDRKGFATCNSLAGTLNATTGDYVDDCGSCGYVTVGAFGRESFKDSLKGTRSTDRKLNTEMAVVNHITMLEILGLYREEVGGDYAEEMFVNGVADRPIMGVKVAQTIKTDLVPNNLMYMFANQSYLGDFCILEDVTLSTKKEDMFFWMWCYELIGMMIANRGAFAMASFTGTFNGWTPAEIGSSS